MNKSLKRKIESDVFRHYGGTNKQFLWKKRNVALLYSITYRKAHFYSSSRGVFGKTLGWFWRYKLNKLMRKYLIQIPFNADIGYGLNIVHFGRVIVAPHVKIGNNCNLFTGITIGSEVRGKRKGIPTLGDNVWVGPNAVIVGRINIGNNVLIAANSYVNFDVPDNSIVIGNPGVIIEKENATEGYICQQYECH